MNMFFQTKAIQLPYFCLVHLRVYSKLLLDHFYISTRSLFVKFLSYIAKFTIFKRLDSFIVFYLKMLVNINQKLNSFHHRIMINTWWGLCRNFSFRLLISKASTMFISVIRVGKLKRDMDLSNRLKKYCNMP